jgi:predicted kinase
VTQPSTILVVCGLSGTGKSTLARELERLLGAPVLSSDAVRKRLAGLAEDERAGEEHYTTEFTRRTYEELGRLAREHGRTVIVDATFREASDRDAFGVRHAAWIECVAPLDVRLERVAGRHDAASDATPGIAASQSFDPLAERHLTVSTERPVEHVAAEVQAWLAAAT